MTANDLSSSLEPRELLLLNPDSQLKGLEGTFVAMGQAHAEVLARTEGFPLALLNVPRVKQEQD